MSRPEPQSASRWLELSKETELGAAFAVVMAAPEGQASSSSPITVAFSHPIRPIALAEVEAKPPILVTPPIQGTWQWLGTNAVTLVSASPVLRPATHYRVTVSAATRDIAGKMLGMPYVFEFDTERPKLVEGISARRLASLLRPSTLGKVPPGAARPPALLPQLQRQDADLCGAMAERFFTSDKVKAGAQNATLLLDDSLLLLFNLPVTPVSIAGQIRLSTLPLTTGQGESLAQVPFELQQPCPDNLRLLELKPKRPLPKGSSIRITADRGLRSSVGELASGAITELNFKTFGKFSAALEPNPEPAFGCRGPILSLSNSVGPEAIESALTIEPQLKWSATHFGDANGYCIDADFDSKQVYSFTLSRDLTDHFRQTLEGQNRWDLRIRAHGRRILIGAQSGILDPAQPRAVPIESRGLSQLNITTVALGPSDLAAWFQRREIEDQIPAFLARYSGNTRTLVPEPGIGSSSVSLIDAIQPHRFGAVGLVVNAEDQPAQARLLQLTDLALAAWLSPTQALIWVTRLSDGRPVPQARLVAQSSNTTTELGATGPDGLAMLGPDAASKLVQGSSAVLLVAQKNQDWSYLETGAIAVAPADLQPTGALFVDRGIYEPGDPIYVKGWLRKHSDQGSAPWTHAQVKLALRAVSSVPGAEAIAANEVTTNEFGGFDGQIRIPKWAHLDDYSVSANVGTQTFSTPLRVGQFRFVEYLVRIDAEEQSAIRGQPLHARVKADYLFGAPVQGGKVEYRTRCIAKQLDLIDGYVFDSFAVEEFDRANCAATLDARPGDSTHRSWDSLRATLDAEGQYRATIESTPFAGGPTQLEFDAEVSDKSQQSVTASTSVLLHPASYYLGMRVLDSVHRVGDAVTAEVVSVDPAGRRLGGKSAKVELWATARSSDGEAEDKPIGVCKVVTSTSAPSSCRIRVTQPGPHRLVVSGMDERGRAMRAAQRLWGSATGWSSRVAPRAVESRITLDRDKYLPGDIAHATLELPWQPSELLVTLMTDRVIWHRTMTARQRTVMLDIPVGHEVSRNAAVSFYAAVGRRGPLPIFNAAPDTLRPQLATASAPFEIDEDLHRLDVTLEPHASTAAPGDKMGLTLAVKDRLGRGKQAEIALLVSDAGAWAVTGYAAPALLQELLEPRNEGMAFADSRAQLGRIYTLRRESSDFTQEFAANGAEWATLGGLAAGVTVGSGPSPRSNFAGTAYFNPHIVTSHDGKAQVEFKLGDAPTQYLLTAVAVSATGDVGAATSSVRTRLPLLLRPVLPRFLREGDRAHAALVVMNQSDAAADVTVAMAARGVKTDGTRSKQVKVAAQGSTRVDFPVTAGELGHAELRFDATAGSLRDVVSASLPIQQAMEPQTVASYGQTSGTAIEQLGDLSAARADRGKLEVQLSSTALTGLDRSLAQIADDDYPSGERIAGRILVEFLLRDLKQAYGIVGPSEPRPTQELVSRLLALQSPRGGFSMWGKDVADQPWLSIYALLALEVAEAAEHAVPASALRAARHYAEDILSGKVPAPREVVGPFAAFVLGRSGHTTWSRLLDLYQRRERMPLHSKALLLEAMANLHPNDAAVLAKQRSAIQELSSALSASFHFDGQKLTTLPEKQPYREVFGSNSRNLAMVLSAILSADPQHPLVERLARALLSARENGLWRSTQETTFALLALDKFRRLREPTAPQFEAKVWLDRRVIGQVSHLGRSLHTRTFSVPIAQLAPKGERVTFELDGAGSLFYEMRLTYVPRQLPEGGLDRGLSVVSSLHRVGDQPLPKSVLDGIALGETEFALGDVLLGQVTVATPSPRDYIAVDVSLPAGLEVIDARLKTSLPSGRWLAGVTSDPVSHEELRDDRVVYYLDHMSIGRRSFRFLARATQVGKFLVPPARAQELYAPEVFGRTGALQVEVK